LADDGSIYVHCDYRLNSYTRIVLDELFGKNNYKNEIVWKKLNSPKAQSVSLGNQYDSIFFYTKSDNFIFNKVYKNYTADQLKMYNKNDKDGKGYYQTVALIAGGSQRSSQRKSFEFRGVNEQWLYSLEKLEDFWKKGRIYKTPSGYRLKVYLEQSEGALVSDMWFDNEVAPIQRAEYPTQKPEKLLERIVKASSNEGDLVADFFCGSGTTLSVAEKLGRKWIGSDLGRFSIHTTRKRMIGVQRELKKSGKDFRAFEILNIGKYEREKFLTVNENLREEEKRIQQENKEKEFIKLILSAYKAEPVDSFNTFVGKKRDRLVAVGSIDTPITNDFLERIISECKEKKITKADVLGFDYEMGLDFESAKKLGIDVQFKVIPREVFDKRAIEKGQVKFYDVAYIEAKPVIHGRGNVKEVAIELTDFSVFYNQDNTGEVEEKLKSGGSKVVIENGQVIKISKDKESDIIEREVLTKKWTDWIDYWSVDFSFESKKEIIKTIDEKTGEEVEEWTGSYIFENEWQSFRTKKDRSLELTSAFKEAPKGKMKIAIKVIDIFGNDTTKVVEVNI
ncbi:MAG: site-specific DNA-methyltransferase, partial [Patescibacteria group bacterium]|nr:site-specific DNA-methyltransferase [Patescibacteria group bacterium]